MIRLFNVYYPTRTLLLVLCESLLIGASFIVTATCLLGKDNCYIELIYNNGLLKIVGITIITMIFSHYFDLYERERVSRQWEAYFRILLVLGALSFVLAAVDFLLPEINIGRNVLVVGVLLLTILLTLWRRIAEWVSSFPLLCERVCVIGNGPLAGEVVEIVNRRRDVGMRIVGRSVDKENTGLDDSHVDILRWCQGEARIDRVIVAVEERRGTMPIRELLDLRLRGVIIEDAGALFERVLGRLPLEKLTPSALIFAEGFKMKASQQIFRRLVSFLVALVALLLCLPLLPIVGLAVHLSSPGPVFFRQQRVGLRGRVFTICKFRTMRQDAEMNGAVWATRGDSRITSVGRFLRKTRLDEIPQLWNVLKGDMEFVGPRPERPEFVRWLSREIPYYDLRHMIRPGLTGWAQVRYQYGATVEETKRKLEYDLYYLKHLSLGLDLLILFETIKTIVLRRGAQ